MHSLAAGLFKAMTVAREALRDGYPGDELTLQQGTRILMRNAPMRTELLWTKPIVIYRERDARHA